MKSGSQSAKSHILRDMMTATLEKLQSSDIELNEVWEPVSKKPYTEGHDDSNSGKILIPPSYSYLQASIYKEKSFMTLAIILLHMFWGVVFFESCERQRWWALGAVVISHLVVSCLTFVNPHYQGSLIPTYIILSVMAAWAYLCAGGSLRNLKLCLTCKDKDFLLANHRPR